MFHITIRPTLIPQQEKLARVTPSLREGKGWAPFYLLRSTYPVRVISSLPKIFRTTK